MKRLMHQWYLRFRLWLIEWQHRGQWGPAWLNVELLCQIAYVTDPWLLSEITQPVAQRTALVTRFLNASELLDWLFYVTRAVDQKVHIKDSIMIPRNDRAWMDLDSWLVNHKGGSVTPVEFQTALKAGLDRLYLAISEVEDADYKEYYHRKLRVHFPDIYAVQEGMLDASLEHYGNNRRHRQQ